MKKRIDQLVHTLSYGDAISGEALALQRVLREIGFESEIYAINEHPKLKGCSKHYTEYQEELVAGHAQGMIMHYSIGSPLNSIYQKLSCTKRFLVYHNITPPKWFSCVNPEVAANINQGIDELPSLLKVTDRIVTDSYYNAEDVLRLGYQSEVLSLPFDPERWQEPANAGIKAMIKNSKQLNLMHVGRLAPNKAIEDIIKVFYFLRARLQVDAKLWLVGIDSDTELYSYSLKKLAAHFHLQDDICFAGQFADSEIKALYEECDFYICMSEHEGFCVPLIEAMHFGLPTIAYGSTAIPGTLADSGVLLDNKNHAEIAALIKVISEDSNLKNDLIAAGKKQLKNYQIDKFTKRSQEIFKL